MTQQQLLLAIALGGLFYLGGQYVASQPQRVEQEVAANREITVTGNGKVMAAPTIAQITLGVTTGPQSNAQAAMELLTRRFTSVVEAVKAEGVAEDDIKTTNLSVNPVYDFREGQQTIRGFEASESIEVKVRDLDKVGAIVSRATQEGVNQAGGIQFVIDDPEDLQREAEAKAIEDARKNAEALADTLGVGLGRVKTFSTAPGVVPPTPFYATAELKAADARGGDVPVNPGTNEISATVQVTYELR
jgi:uncharacterized protein YggE